MQPLLILAVSLYIREFRTFEGALSPTAVDVSSV